MSSPPRPGIAVVVTCFELGRWLPEALASVRAQTRPASEIIVVDDGSTDLATRQFLARLVRDGVRVIRHDRNRGLAAARNTGIAATTAPYVAALDADDLWPPEYCAQLAAALDADPALDFVTCPLRAFGDAEYDWTPPPLQPVEVFIWGGPHASTMLRREVWERVGGYDPALTSYELTDFWLGALARGCRGTILDTTRLGYRVRADSLYALDIGRQRYVELMREIAAKHRTVLAPHLARIIVARERFRGELREVRNRLETRRQEVRAEREAVGREVTAVADRLRELGEPAFDWGDLDATPLPAPGTTNGPARVTAERFLATHRADLRGRVLDLRPPGEMPELALDLPVPCEIVTLDPSVLHPPPRGGRAGVGVPDDCYDCLWLPGTLSATPDTELALARCVERLAPGGTLLALLPAVYPATSHPDPETDWHRFTAAGARQLFARHFPLDAFSIEPVGNAAAVAAAAHRLDYASVPAVGRDQAEPGCPLLLAVRAVKPAAGAPPTEGPVSQREQDVPSLRPPPAVISAPSPRRAGTAVVLAYHRVAELPDDNHELCVTPAAFRRQMEYLRDRCRPLPLAELAAAAAAGTLPDGAVAITFDDGYRDALTAAAPILRELGLPATVFVTGEALDTEREYWWDTLTRVFRTDLPLPPFLTVTMAGRRERFATGSADARRETGRRLHVWLMTAGPEERDRLLDKLLTWCGLDLAPRPPHRTLLADEIVRLARQPGLTIGAHTLTHRSLPDLPPTELARELTEGRTRLETLLGQPVLEFSYPFGEYTGPLAPLVARAGYTTAVTVEDRAAAGGERPLLLPRCEVREWEPDHFASWLESRFNGE